MYVFLFLVAAAQIAGMVWAWRWLGTTTATGDEGIRPAKRLAYSALWPFCLLCSWIDIQ